jgi:hypothetical protein
VGSAPKVAKEFNFVGFDVIAAVVMKTYLLGYNAVSSVESQPTFRRNMSPLSSGLKSKPDMKQTVSRAWEINWQWARLQHYTLRRKTSYNEFLEIF